MSEQPQQQISVRVIEDEMKQAYMAYAMSVIVGRALPDARDGLKPVHRRILFAMHQNGMQANQPHKKSARIVGETLGKYHPHGDSAVYDSLVRMAQDFSLRYPLIDGQGNFGCFTGDTKVRLADGRNLSFKELVEEYKQGKKNFTFTMDDTGSIKIAEVKHPRITKTDAELVRVTLDNGEEIMCTPDHRFLLRTRKYREAQNLKPGDSIAAINFRFSTNDDAKQMVGYEMVYQPESEEWEFCHVLADKWNLEQEIYEKSAGRVRHHVDFNKRNNDPTNIQRMQWVDHRKLHAELASELHKDPIYRAKIAEGRRLYWSDQENREKASKALSQRNKEWWSDPAYRKKMTALLKETSTAYAKNHPELAEQASKRLKALWKDKDFRQMMSDLKSEEMKRRWKDGDLSIIQSAFDSEESKVIWSNPKHRAFVSSFMKNLWKDPLYKKRMSEQSKQLWKNPEYRSKFPENHFSSMAKKLWNDSKTKKLHSTKAKKQWEDESFRKARISELKIRNKKRMQQDPDCMKKIAAHAAKSLKQKWMDPSYKKRVVGNRVLSYVNSLLTKHEVVTPEIYEKERTNNTFPKLETALTYFDDFNDMIEKASVYNHKVVNVEFLVEKQDVYDITIDHTHNFALAAGVFVHNSIDADPAAAQRYTEARLAKISSELLSDIEKETVDWMDNFDGSEREPTVLPTVLPNLLLNGSSGIAVGMATNIPPHNLHELTDAILQFIDNPELSPAELMQYLPGPDFPTGGIICGSSGILAAYKFGRGKVRVRAVIQKEETKKNERLIITEFPYQVVKADTIEYIANLVRDKKIEGIADIRDESDRRGIRVVIELKRDANADVVEAALYKYTRLQVTFGVNTVALVNGQPKLLSLPKLLGIFLDHRKVVIRRRTKFDLRKAKERAHLLEGLLVALDNIDAVVALIKKAESGQIAQKQLMERYDLSDVQSKAILEMRLQRLTGLEQDKIRSEHKNLLEKISDLQDILARPERVVALIKEELARIREKYGDTRRTQIIEAVDEIDIEDLIEQEEMVVSLTHQGYVKRVSVDTYQAQRRGGVGIIGAKTRDDDVIENIFIANTHSYVLFFTSKGRVHWKKVYQIPEGSRTARGSNVVNLLQLDKEEKVSAAIPVKIFDDEHYLVFATKNGVVKKTVLSAYSRPRQGGINAINLVESDDLVNVVLTDGDQALLLASKNGQAVRFSEKDIRPMGRTATGVRGMGLQSDDTVVSLSIAPLGSTVLTITEQGFGKRSPIEDYRLIKRGGLGVRNIQTTSRNGKVVSVRLVSEDDELLIMSRNGVTIRTKAKDISLIGRNTQGVRIMRMREGDSVAAVAKIVSEAEE